MFSNNFANNVENHDTIKTITITRETITLKDCDLILNTIKNFENHPSIKTIKD